jgi:Fe-S-cluster-containing dehydrogenase component
MRRLSISQDLDGCIGCYSCEVHCKTAKGLGAGPRLCRIYAAESSSPQGRPRIAFAFVTCRHCDDAECLRICPSGAVRKRAEDGVVFVDQELCVGCQLCVHACPWGVPQYDASTKVVLKCDLCRDRLDRGLAPACVTKCVTGCLTLHDPDQPSEQAGCSGEGDAEVSS